jgi:hypothetical protein
MYYSSAIYLIYYFSKKFINEVFRLKLSEEQVLLRGITGRNFPKEEAARLWTKINEHKWHLGEILGRDVGIGAATLDYLENFTGEIYAPDERENSNDVSAYLNNSFA